MAGNRIHAMIVCNARSGSTFLSNALNQLSDAKFDFEFVFYPKSFHINQAQINVPEGISCRYLLDGFAKNSKIAGSKLVFGYNSSLVDNGGIVLYERIEKFIESFCGLKIIWLTRDHFDLLVSYTAGPIHKFSNPSRSIFAKQANHPGYRRYLDIKTSVEYLQNYVIGDILSAEISKRNESMIVDYNNVWKYLETVAEFIGSDDDNNWYSNLLNAPPTYRTRAGDSNLIEQQDRVRKLASLTTSHRNVFAQSEQPWHYHLRRIDSLVPDLDQVSSS